MGFVKRRIRILAVTSFTDVPASEWESWVDDADAIVLDVREPDEWELGTLPGAVLISQGEIVDKLDDLPKDKPVLCVCRSGGRSANVATFLAFNGYEVANMSGGMKALGMQD
jgi:rhodanese-related sulfurtransferase